MSRFYVVLSNMAAESDAFESNIIDEFTFRSASSLSKLFLPGEAVSSPQTIAVSLGGCPLVAFCLANVDPQTLPTRQA